MRNRIKLLSILLLASCIAFVSCKEDKNADVKVTGVTLSDRTLNLHKGDVKKLTAAVFPDNAKEKAVRWETSNDSIVKVDANGNLTAIEIGTATITVRTTDGNYIDNCNVTVTAKPQEPQEDHYSSTAFIGVYLKATQQLTTTFPLIVGNGATFPLIIPSGSTGLSNYAVYVMGNNTSGKTIPKGATVKFRFKIEGAIVPINGNTEITGALNGDIENGKPFVLMSFDAFAGVPLVKLGDNQFCLDILQVGGKEYSTPSSACCTLTVSEAEAQSQSTVNTSGKSIGDTKMPTISGEVILNTFSKF